MPKFRIEVKKSRRKKPNGQDRKKFSYKKTLSIFLPFLIIVLVISFFYILYIKSPYFVVRNTIMIGKDSLSAVDYDELQEMIIDKNIFLLKLSDIRNYMLTNYHELLELQLKREFPNSIIAEIFLRKPVAQLYKTMYYPIDSDGVILSDVKTYPEKELPIINGIRSNLSKELGKRTDSKKAQRALLLLKELKDSGILDRHTLVEIDVSSLRNIIFFLEDGLEVKIGYEDYASRLENLKEVLSDAKLKPKDIRYIDLRFKEPVIGPKWKR